MITGPRKLVDMAVFISGVLKIEHDYQLEIKRQHMDIAGQCEHLDGAEFLITLDKAQHKSEFVRSLGHEMVHMRQYLNGDLEDVGPLKVNDINCYVCKWRNETHINTNSMADYFLTPWEMEARAYESYIEWMWENRK